MYQNRILNWGIIVAIVMRAAMIGAGAVALQQFHVVLLEFSAILIYSSAKVLIGSDDDEEDFSQNAIVKFSNNIFESTNQFDGDRFFTLIDGVKMATPMLLCMVAIEFSDVVFAVDSIPAVFGVTEVSFQYSALYPISWGFRSSSTVANCHLFRSFSQNPLVVFSSNMFAIMGLRSLHTILSKAASDLKYLEPAVAVGLGFIGSKMVAEYFGVDVPTEVSLGVVATLLGTGVRASLLDKSDDDDEEGLS